MSTADERELKHREHVLAALLQLGRAGRLHQITTKEQLKLIDSECPHVAGEPVVLFDQVTVNGIEAFEVSIPKLFGQCLAFGTKGGQALGLKNEDITVEIVDGFIVFRFFIGHRNSNKNRPAGTGQAPYPATHLDGGAR